MVDLRSQECKARPVFGNRMFAELGHCSRFRHRRVRHVAQHALGEDLAPARRRGRPGSLDAAVAPEAPGDEQQISLRRDHARAAAWLRLRATTYVMSGLVFIHAQ
jgi:hypothetical protein